MPRARSRTYDDWRKARQPLPQAAAAGQGSGCLSGFVIPPLAVLLVSGFLALLALRQPAAAQAQGDLTAAPAAQVALPSPTPLLASDTSLAPVAVLGNGLSQESPATPQAPDLNGDGLPDDGLSSIPTAAAMQAEIVQATPVPQQATFVQELTPTPQAGLVPEIQAAIVGAQEEANRSAGVYTGTLAAFFRPEVLYWEDSILRWSSDAGVDPNLAAVVMQIESCGDPRATSRSGAMGLFQVMPFHFRAGDDPYAPDTNALRGLSYLARSLKAANGDARLALAGYNGGIGVISRGEWTWAAETARYVYFGGPMYEDARQGRSQSSALDEWYSKYGVSLCRQASLRQ